LELRQLRYFVEVAEREHMTEAAENLHVAQSAVSLQISKLEDELGVTLFERVGRNLKLTDIGRTFLFHIKKALQDIDYAKSKVEEYLDPDHGTVKVAYPSSFANHILPTVISNFKLHYPDVKFHLRQGTYAYLRHAVKNGDINIAFMGPAPPDDAELKVHILFTEKFYVLAPIHHRFADREEISLHELKNDDFVLFSEGFILRKIVIDACSQAGFLPNITSEGEDIDAIKGLVSAGIGLSILPENTLYHSTPRMTKKIRITQPDVSRSVGIIASKTRELAPSERIFYQFVTEYFSKLQGFNQ
jgi:LysR family transcriptional activator of glutamate synthase operon